MRRFLVPALLCAVLVSCKTPSFRGQDEAVFPAVTEPEAPAVETATAETATAETADAAELAVVEPEVPSVGDAPEEAPEEPVEISAGDLPPEPEFPDVIAFPEPSPEEVAVLEYPEPEPPYLPLLPEPAPEPKPEPELALVPEEPPAPEPPPPPPSPEPPPSLPPPPPPPAPPPFIRPAETAQARPAPREPLPVPVNPVPEPPARQPPVTVRPAPPAASVPQAPVRPPAQIPVQPPARTGPAVTAPPASPGDGDAVTYSRTIRGTTGQILEVPFRGTGWVYLGEANARKGISYVSRRADSEGLSFIFRLDEKGDYELKFYKQDFIRDYILNDHVRVIVEDAPDRNSFFYPEESGKVVAEPRWPLLESSAGRTPGNETSPPANTQGGQLPAASAAAASGGGQPGAAAGPGTAPAVPAGDDALQPEVLLRRAREQYEAGHFLESLAALDEFRTSFPLGSDEAWWLYGQLLEAPGPQRDVRGALEYYRRLIREYPQSPRCDDAERRIAYLERFYFNIR